MGLSTRINDVPVRASRRQSGYSFHLLDVLEAAGVSDDAAHRITGMYRDSGDAARPGSSRLWFVGAGEIRDYISRMRGGLPEDASAMTDGQLDDAGAMARLEECVAACERWAASRGISGWETSGSGPEEADWGVAVNGILVRAARSMDGTWFFEPSGMLRAAGVPDDMIGELVEACRSSVHAAEHRLPGTSGPVWLVDLDGCGEYIACRRKTIRYDVLAELRRDGAAEALDRLDETEDALCRLEECIAGCGRWAASLEGCSVGEAGDGPSPRRGPACWDSPQVDPYDRPGLVPEEADGMADALLDRLPVLCRAFGISQFMDRERQLARIIWLMAFRGGPVDCPADGTSEAAFLWRGMDRRDVRDLVGSAMAD